MKRDRSTLVEALDYWHGAQKRRSKGKGQKEQYNSMIEIWTNTIVTNNFVLGKVEGFPWWPARVCKAKDPGIASLLEETNRVLISFVGERHLHVVNGSSEIMPFATDFEEDSLSKQFSTDIVKNLKEVSYDADKYESFVSD